MNCNPDEKIADLVGMLKLREGQIERLQSELAKERACHDCREYRTMKDAELAAVKEEVHAENEKFRKADELAQMWEQRERMKTGELAAANERAEKRGEALQNIADSLTCERDHNEPEVNCGECGQRRYDRGGYWCAGCIAREALRSTPAQEPKPLPLGHPYTHGYEHGCGYYEGGVLSEQSSYCGQPESAHQPTEEGR